MAQPEYITLDLDELFEPTPHPVIEWGSEGPYASPRVSRQHHWYESSPQVVGLQVPGLFKKRRDQALLDKANVLLGQWSKLFREVYNLDRRIKKGDPRKIREGMATIAERTKTKYRAYFDWLQQAQKQEVGQFEPTWHMDLQRWTDEYQAAREKVATVLLAQGKDTATLPGRSIYSAPTEGETWTDWLGRNVLPTSGSGLVLVVVLGGFLFLWGGRRQ